MALKMKLNKNEIKDKIFGCWIGKNIGGTIGGPYEGTEELLDVKGFSSSKGEPLPNDDLDLQLVWLRAMEYVGPKALDANADGFTMALSPSAIRETVGMPPQTYRDQFVKLIDKKYLVQTGGNTYEFYEQPQHAAQPYQNTQTNDSLDFTETVCKKTQDVCKNTAEDIEININTINNISQEKQVSPAIYYFLRRKKSKCQKKKCLIH